MIEPRRNPRPGRRAWVAAGLLAAFGLAERVLLWTGYAPVEYSDTGAYLRAGRVLRLWTLDGVDGRRVPGYPAFTALAGGDAQSIYVLQLGLGLVISLLLFWMTFRTTRSAALGFSVGLLYDLIPGQFLFEANLLTETLTAFLLALGLTLLLELLRSATRGAEVFWALLLGIVGALAGLVRAEYFYLPVWLLLFVVSRAGGLRRAVVRLAAFLPGPSLLLGGWLWFIYSTYGMIAPTVVTGFGLVQHTGSYFEYLPDSAAPIRDTYVRLRDERIAQRGDQTNTIWGAIPELSRVSGLSFYDLSREIQRLSVQLVLEHPTWYARSVADGWMDFWKAPVYWSPQAIESPALRAVLSGWASAGRMLSLVANGLFLLGTAAVTLSRQARLRLGVDRHMLAAAGTVWVVSILQTLFEHGDNPRFLVPTQMLVIYVVARMAYAWWRRTTDKEVLAA
ncbi:MAG: hypothetical protein MUO35_08850 [Anaerolineales bacterium]|nr:hypothetical protein [Anaerolineales bacterium]